MGILGLILLLGGGGAAWWLFSRAAGEGYFDIAVTAALVVGLIGLILLFFRVRRWWMSEL